MSEKRPYTIRITRQAKKDIETLLGDLVGSYSYRLTYQDRVVYSIDESTQTVYIERARTHYGS